MSDQLYEWRVAGMDCPSCALKITRALEKTPGVSEISVSVMAERLSLRLSPVGAKPEEVQQTLEKLGYQAEALNGVKKTSTDDHAHHDHPPQVHLLVLMGLLLALAWGIEIFVNPDLGYYTFAVACLIGLAPIARRAWAALRTGQPFTIEALMTLAALGALWISAVEEAAFVVFLFILGEMLEGFAARKARDGIRALANLVPKTALLDRPDGPQEVAADQLSVGQVILVRPGDRIAADGQIIAGGSGIDESPVTGESVPISKGLGDEVFAGSINIDALLRIRVTKSAQDNTIARIIHLVEEAQSQRAPTERFIDRFSRWYMPAIVVFSALVILVPPLAFEGDWQVWIYRGLALLLIGCPCALVISVPASIASALAAGARRGLLMKGGAVIETLAKTKITAFDKTGTLTMGTPVVTDILPAPSVEKDELLRLAAAVEAGSSHPLALAITALAKEQNLNLPAAYEAKALAGKGVTAKVEGADIWIGSPRFAEEMIGTSVAAQAEPFEAEGKTVVTVFRQNEYLGAIALRDEPRAEAREALKDLAALNIRPVMLTGDNARTAKAIGLALGIDQRAEMLPEDKLRVIADLTKEGPVMMIGDGINDAPALKQAAVGVAMGSGTDVALETADAALLRNNLNDVSAMIRLSRKTMSNIQVNIALALGLKAIFLVTSVLGLTGLWVAILADTGATVLVTLNALQLLRYDPSIGDKAA